MRREALGSNWAVVVPFVSCGEEHWTAIDVYSGAMADLEAKAHAHRCSGATDANLRRAVAVKVTVSFRLPREKAHTDAGERLRGGNPSDAR